MSSDCERGAATVEHAALGLLIALIAAAGIAAVASGPLDGGRELGSTLARKLRCAARGPGPCWRDPLTEAYGRPLAGAARAFAPAPATRSGQDGAPLYPVDFRHCRSPSCAVPGPRSPALTVSNRRTTTFVAITDRRRASDLAEITYWLYRPTLAWERIRRVVNSAEVEALAATPLLDADVPVLVPLETLPGANHFRFPPAEEPPWRWQIERRVGG